MDLISPTTIKKLLADHQRRPSKGLGQNFLIDKNVLDKIIISADIKSSDIVLEIGPGVGTLTQELAKKAKRVVAVEKDETMLKILEKTISSFKNVETISADILKLDLKPYTQNPYKVVANIPYYLTSPLIRKFLESANPPSEMVLMLQKEVAQRICAKPPSPPTNFGRGMSKNSAEKSAPKLVGGKMSLLAVSVQFYSKPEIVFYVSKNCFWPSPKIDSAVIKITPYRSPASVKPENFFNIVKAGFSQPRKQLAGNLSKILKIEKIQIEKWLLKNKVNPTQRAETLSIKDWENLTKTYLSITEARHL